eukprot:CAMPEP_0119364794 /NCGR_PEP_ID=MMETSP1334-20130426/11720_1 /TAXON_ID=127549 /ORGANISM="Calcidiscus leptoporus, Strain RCC1130" /LENGTH=56 /DNA_ID=CAMNT_0007380589 /DNA_START=519 /DNA_END=685 /DNA_ORIENTATION=+
MGTAMHIAASKEDFAPEDREEFMARSGSYLCPIDREGAELSHTRYMYTIIDPNYLT